MSYYINFRPCGFHHPQTWLRNLNKKRIQKFVKQTLFCRVVDVILWVSTFAYFGENHNTSPYSLRTIYPISLTLSSKPILLMWFSYTIIRTMFPELTWAQQLGVVIGRFHREIQNTGILSLSVCVTWVCLKCLFTCFGIGYEKWNWKISKFQK